MKPGTIVMNDTVPSGLRREAISLLNSPKSNIVDIPSRVTVISPSAELA